MYFETTTGYILSAFVLLIGGCICLLVGRQLAIKPAWTLALYGWHTIFAFVFYLFILSEGGDALAYYNKARFEYISLVYGTEFVVWVTSYPAGMGFSFLSTNLLFNVVGSVGFLFYCAALRDATAGTFENSFSRALALLCAFLPSVSFWASGIGKDAIAFLAVGVFTWSAAKLERRFYLLVVAILFMLAVRPHIAALMVICVALGALFIRRLHGALRVTFGFVALIAAGIAVPVALLYAGTDRFENLESYVEDRQSRNLQSDSGVDIGSMNPILRLPSYIYRPMPIEASGGAQLAASVENLVLVLLTIVGMVGIIKAGFRNVLSRYPIQAIYGVIGIVILSQVTANLGLASRQKWMMLPPLMVVTVGAWSIVRERKIVSERRRRSQLAYMPGAR